MTQSDAEKYLQTQFDVSRETLSQLRTFVDFLIREAQSQNLIAASTIDDIWQRHIIDSAQLLHFVKPSNTPLKWLDLGSGAGFPGLIVALLSHHEVALVESRSKRIDFLQRAVSMLGLESRVSVAGVAVERLERAPYAVISARAFAPLPRLFNLAARFSTAQTLWLLPKGRNAAREWEEVQRDWVGEFRIENSITDNDAGILVGHLTAKRENAVGLALERQKAR